MKNLLVVALGGAMGSLTRYQLGIWIATKWNQGFPLPTFLINISGAFLLGFLNTLFLERFTVSPLWRLGIGVGFLGAYTTFSTFGYEVMTLIEAGSIKVAVVYTIASILVGILGVALGIWLARTL